MPAVDFSNRKVIILSGPAGSGKTTTAEEIARQTGWAVVSEDEYWVKIKIGHPISEHRTPEEEKVVQAQSLEELVTHLTAGKNAVLELILYQSPPQPIIFYREALLKLGVHVLVRLLKPSADTIMARKIRRGYAHDQDEEQERKYAAQQLGCLNDAYFGSDWVIDNTDETIPDIYDNHFKGFADGYP